MVEVTKAYVLLALIRAKPTLLFIESEEYKKKKGSQ
jgi:hypothetical protein